MFWCQAGVWPVQYSGSLPKMCWFVERSESQASPGLQTPAGWAVPVHTTLAQLGPNTQTVNRHSVNINSHEHTQFIIQ